MAGEENTLLGLRFSPTKPLQRDFLAKDKEGILSFNMCLLFPAFWLIYLARGGVTRQMCRIQTALPCTMTVNKECDPHAS